MLTIGEKSTRLVLVRLNQGESRKGDLTPNDRSTHPSPWFPTYREGLS